MVKLYDEGIYLVNGTEIVPESEGAKVQALTGKAAGNPRIHRLYRLETEFLRRSHVRQTGLHQ